MRILTILSILLIIFISGCNKEDTLTGNKDIQWVYVKGGTFVMGKTGKLDGKSGYTVTLSDFYISKYEVTNAQFAEFLNAYKSNKVKSGINAGKMICWEYMWGVEKTDSIWAPVTGYENYPALNISFAGATEFCLFNGWRLATEAEWEYAALGGRKSKGYEYSGSDSIDLVAWYEPVYEGRPGTNSHPVGQKQPNELGIYDMSGNVWEWVSDYYAIYPERQFTNPTGPETGKYHIYRGGSWLSVRSRCTNDYRCTDEYDMHGVTHNGIRCVKPR
jgi:formylglycine-generating enzyme